MERKIKTNIIKCNKLLLETYINPIYIKLNVHFTIATDLNFNDDLIKILPLITMDSNFNIFNVDILFPGNNKINYKAYQWKIKEIIETMFPEPIKSQLLINYNKYIHDDNK